MHSFFLAFSFQCSWKQKFIRVVAYTIPFYYWIVFCCVSRLHCSHPFFSWRTFRSFPLFWPLWIMLLWTSVYRFFCGHRISILLGIYLGGDWLDLTFGGTVRLFSNLGAPFYILTSSVWGFQFLHILVWIYYCLSFNLAILVGVK